MFFKNLKVHIGLHKTATTHFQNTLDLMRLDLLNHDINYTPMKVSRSDLRNIHPRGIKNIIYKLSPNIIKSLYLRPYIFNNHKQLTTFLKSEENILGGALDALSTRQYPYLEERLKFIEVFARQPNINSTIFMAIRSLDKVFPGAYVTGLRFNPKRAMQLKTNLITKLNTGEKLSLLPLFQRINNARSNSNIKIWTQEQYKNQSKKIIRGVLELPHIYVPELPPPQITSTPNADAVAEIEALVTKNPSLPKNWTKVCDNIYSKNQANSATQKYTFLSKDKQEIMKDQYDKDIKEISKIQPDIWLIQP